MKINELTASCKTLSRFPLQRLPWINHLYPDLIMHPRAVYVAEVWAVEAHILGQSRILSLDGRS